METTLVRTQNLIKDYALDGDVVHAVRGVSLSISAGEFVALMGPSGSGKSTFLNVIGCLDEPTGGEYWLGGARISLLRGDALAKIRNKNIGFVFQAFNLIPRMTAAENVELPLVYANVAKSERRTRARKGLAAVGLEHRLNHWPSQLSGGQQQRVAIARALINDPLLVLADEPTGSLDSQASSELMALFTDLHSKGTTILIVTHEREVAAYAQRILFFRDGVITNDIRPAMELSRRSSNPMAI